MSQKEKDAWTELMSYVEFVDKCKRRKYRNVKQMAPTISLPAVETEFLRRLKEWERAWAATYKARSETPPATAESRPPSPRPRLPAGSTRP